MRTDVRQWRVYSHICLLSCKTYPNLANYLEFLFIEDAWYFVMPSFLQNQIFFFLQVAATWTNSLDFFLFTVVIAKFVTILIIQPRDLPCELKKKKKKYHGVIIFFFKCESIEFRNSWPGPSAIQLNMSKSFIHISHFWGFLPYDTNQISCINQVILQDLESRRQQTQRCANKWYVHVPTISVRVLRKDSFVRNYFLLLIKPECFIP